MSAAGPANVITDVVSSPPLSWEGTRIPKKSMEISSVLGAKSLSEHSSKFWSTCKPTHSELHGIKLALIVDDDEIGHVVVAQCLEPLGFKVRSEQECHFLESLIISSNGMGDNQVE